MFTRPYIGDFGWELLWNAHLRALRPECDHMSIAAENYKKPMYEFADSFHSIRANKGGARINPVTEPQHRMRNEIRKWTNKGIVPELYTPTAEKCLEEKKFIPFGNESDEKYDIVFHARWYRDMRRRWQCWTIPYWGELSDFFAGKKMCCVGRWAFNIPGMDDRRDATFPELCDIIRNSKLFVSPFCGHVGLALMCGTRTVTWASDRVTKYVGNFRNMMNLLNPFDTPAVMLDKHKWNPSPRAVKLTIVKNLEKD